MFGIYCTVRLYVLSVIAPSAYISCTIYLYVFFGVAPSAYMFDRLDRGQKLTESCGKTPVAPSTYMLVHALPIYLPWEEGETGSAYCTVYLYGFRARFHDYAVVPLAGVCCHDLGNKVGMRAEGVKYVDDLSAFALLLAGNAEENIALFQRAEGRVDGFPVDAAAGVVQKAAVALDGGKFNPIGLHDAGIGVLVR
jgi:hypothetical protein